MAFNIEYLGRVSSSANTQALKVWTYNGTSTGSDEAVATIVASGYFNSLQQNLTSGSESGPLAVGDVIHVHGNDANGMYVVSSITTNVAVGSYAAIGSVDTANLANGAVTTDKLGALAVTAAKIAADAVTTAKILDANVTSAKVEATLIQHAQVDLTLAEFIALYTTSFELVAAPGANKKLQMLRGSLYVNYGGTVLANGGAVHVQYDSTANGAGTKASQTLAAATLIAATADTSFGFTPVDTTLVDSATANKGLYLAMATADFTGGTGSVYKFDTWYAVQNLT